MIDRDHRNVDQLLKDRGWDVTQSTLSRDLRELRLARIPTNEGPRYASPESLAGEDERTLVEHVLAAEVTCAPQRDLDAKRNITGVFQHWDCIDPGWNPGGIWRPVRTIETGPARIMSMRVLCPAADATRARVRIRANIGTAVSGPA